ncbi:hypothetical protein [Actinoplanes solisilvae]|uniref:hypothetical protein n=1 Tax=Actinoplanes solisilvae TaxID=2486853 RepID=UPI000FD6DB0D|nr:hypothetical protein [Actinoplanes solisilvae]
MTIARPPRSWETKTLAVLAAVGAAALLTMVLLVTDLALRSYALSGATGAVSPLVAAVVEDPYTLDCLNIVLLVAYIGAFYWWRAQTRTLLTRVNVEPGAVVTHWGIAGWGLCLGLSFVVRLALSGSGQVDDLDSLATALGYDALALTFRLVGLSLLLIGVWQIREQVRLAVAGSGVALRVSDLGSLASAPTTAAPLAPLARAEIKAEGEADDYFWTRIGEQARAAGADLALLETTGTAVHRWFLVPATGETDAVRAVIAPGAVVTIFAEPPAADFTAPEGDEFYGLLEDSETGALWFQSVRPNRVPAFLARARTARRWALYPAASATAQSAVVPAAH